MPLDLLQCRWKQDLGQLQQRTTAVCTVSSSTQICARFGRLSSQAWIRFAVLMADGTCLGSLRPVDFCRKFALNMLSLDAKKASLQTCVCFPILTCRSLGQLGGVPFLMELMKLFKIKPSVNRCAAAQIFLCSLGYLVCLEYQG